MTTLSKIGKNVGKAIGGSQSLEGQLGGTFLNNVAFGGTGVNVLTPPGQDSGQYTQDQVNAYLASLAQGGGGDTTGGGTIDSTGGSSGGSSSGGSDSLASAETDINRFMRDFGLDQASALAALQLQSLDASQAQANLGIQQKEDYLKQQYGTSQQSLLDRLATQMYNLNAQQTAAGAYTAAGTQRQRGEIDFARSLGLGQLADQYNYGIRSSELAKSKLGIQDYLKNFELNQQKTAADVERYKRAMAGL